MATCGELVSTHMPKKSRVENWLHERQLLASVTLPLGGTVLSNRISKYLLYKLRRSTMLFCLYM